MAFVDRSCNLNHGQVTRTTPELLLPSSNFHPTPMRERFSFEMFNVHLPPLHDGASAVLGWNYSGYESVTSISFQLVVHKREGI
ncbi:hypothetical protein TNCV_2317101 [Trichonephila clavipes]|nr:hypothetical protein TNCV_2317101 [Trichonephila clavipes]